jgi:hypothetical protein
MRVKIDREGKQIKYWCAPVSAGNTFEDQSQLHKTVDNTKRYIRVTYLKMLKFNLYIRVF